MQHPKSRHTFTLSIWFGYLFFVVYGSLVPFDYTALPLDDAWNTFQHIQMLQLGVQSRADWISNGVLFVPVGFLTAHLLSQLASRAQRVPLFILAGVFSVALAIGIEFVQLFFPARTVSLNDILAESIGSLIGLMLAARYSEWFKLLLNAVFNNPRKFTLRLLEAYLAGYVAFSLFPYDILLSGAEFAQKMRGINLGWFLAGDSHGRMLPAAKSLAEIILTLPFGLLLGYRSARQPVTYRQAAFVGLLLGGCIEIAQLFIASGVTQGFSVVTRIAGVCGGLALWNRRSDWSPERLADLTSRYALPLGLIYLLIVLEANGWFSHSWIAADVAVSRLSEIHFLPFYYHYYTSEAKALVSLVSVCLTYLPIGLLIWSKRGSPAQGGLYGLFAASLVETGKLFIQNLHPDPTNILLGALASWLMIHLAREFSKAASITLMAEAVGLHTVPNAQNQPLFPPRKQLRFVSERPRHRTTVAILLPSFVFAAYWTASFPTQPVLLGLFLTACAAIVWRCPAMLVAIIPAALPVLDLAPWSGRFFLDEFDLLVIISLAIGYCRIPHAQHEKQHSDTLFNFTKYLVAISFLISAARGLGTWHSPDANTFNNYYSPFNALRIGKGALWAYLSYGLLRRMVAAGLNVQRPFAYGLIAGLALTVAAAIWERMAFSGLFNFSSDYRITGPFSAMHTGGAYIECFLAIATPYLLLLILQHGSWLVRIVGTALLLATTYALMVTFSRNGYSAFGVVLLIILFFGTFKSGRWQQRCTLAIVLSGAILAVAIPVFTGKFAQDRIATVDQDYAVRQAHWQDALNIRSPDLLTTLFGMGLGRYPETHYLLSRELNHSGTYQLVSENKNTFLRLVSGYSIYLDQFVSVAPKLSYVLKLDARSDKPDAKITVAICEKWLLASYNCMWNSLEVGKTSGVWHHIEARLSVDQMIVSPWYSRRPIKLSLLNGNDKAVVDVDNVRLENMQGENLLRNGDFANDLDYWFLSADGHLQWHVKSLPVAVLFDQGWFGLIALCGFSILAIKQAAGRAWRGDLTAAAALASFSGFLVVALFDTLIDAPRFLFLFLMLAWLSGTSNISSLKELQHD